MGNVCLDVSAHGTPGETGRGKRVHTAWDLRALRSYPAGWVRTRACKWSGDISGSCCHGAGAFPPRGAQTPCGLRAKLQPTRPSPSHSRWTLDLDLSRLEVCAHFWPTLAPCPACGPRLSVPVHVPPSLKALVRAVIWGLGTPLLRSLWESWGEGVPPPGVSPGREGSLDGSEGWGGASQRGMNT